MRSLTTIEAQFLEHLKTFVSDSKSEESLVQGVYITEAPTTGPSLQIGLNLLDVESLVYFDVLIFGVRPVRYHLQSELSSLTAQCRFFWRKILGALNLVSEKSGERKGRFHLYYEISYPDQELKRLGEK